MILTPLVRLGEVNISEWETQDTHEYNNVGINIMTKEVSSEVMQVLVEFTIGGIVWRRCLYGVVSPSIVGVQFGIPAASVNSVIKTIGAAFDTETNGGTPILTLTTMAGNPMISALTLDTVLLFETRQQLIIHTSQLDPTIEQLTEQLANIKSDTEELLPYIPDDDGGLSSFQDWMDDD